MNDYGYVYRYQIVAGVLLLIVCGIAFNIVIGLSCLYGSALMALGSWELAGRLKKSEISDPDLLQATLYKGAVMRFVLILIGLAAGYVLGLHLPAIAGGMFAAQVLFYFASLQRYRAETGD